MASERYDILIVGSGVAGSILGVILGRMGVRVLVIEKDAHPRFTIGESTLPTTTLLLRRLAAEHDVPELAEIAHYFGLRRLGITCYPKQQFWFGYHRPGEAMQDGEEMMFETARPPVGPDVHVLREELDAYLVSLLPKYGVDYSERTELAGFEYDDKQAIVRLKTSDEERTVHARYVIDATGHASYFARRFNLREEPTRLKTRSRTIFGHFRGVRPLEEVAGVAHRFRRDRERGTVHHVFDGGWLWVIPFDNGITSVGLQVDPDRFPIDAHVPPEMELQRWIEMFPSVREHLGEMQPIRPVVRSGRIQFSTTRILGDGFALTPHAAGFIDPLYSTGLLHTATFITRFAAMLPGCLATDDFSRERLQPIEDHFQTELEHMDRVVSGSFASFRDFEVFKQYWRTFTHASCVQYFAAAVVPTEYLVDNPVLYGACFPDWLRTVREMEALVTDRSLEDAATASRLKSIMDEVPHVFRQSRYEPPDGTPVHLDTWIDQPYIVRYLLSFVKQAEIRDHARVVPQIPMLMDVLGYGTGRPRLAAKYYLSKIRGGGFHHWMDRIDGAAADVEPAGPTEFEIERPTGPLSGGGRRIDTAHTAIEHHGSDDPTSSQAADVPANSLARESSRE